MLEVVEARLGGGEEEEETGEERPPALEDAGWIGPVTLEPDRAGDTVEGVELGRREDSRSRLEGGSAKDAEERGAVQSRAT